MFYDGYLQIKELAKGKLDVFFGFEYGYKGTDILVYGWDKEKLLQIPQIMQMSTREFIEFANDSGALTVHAHPFREAHYIDHIDISVIVEGFMKMSRFTFYVSEMDEETETKQHGKDGISLATEDKEESIPHGTVTKSEPGTVP